MLVVMRSLLSRVLPAPGSGSKWSLWSQDSILSIGSSRSLGSLLSDRSRWSVLSYASARAVLSARDRP